MILPDCGDAFWQLITCGAKRSDDRPVSNFIRYQHHDSHEHMEKTIQTKQSSENNITQDGSTVNKWNNGRDDSRESLHTKTSSQKEHNITVSSTEHLHQTADNSIETMLDSEEKIIDIDTNERCNQTKEDDSNNTTITSCRADCNPIEHGRRVI